MLTDPFPRMLAVRQKFPASPPVDIRATVQREFEKVRSQINPGTHVAVAVGSRGITNVQTIVAAVLDAVKAAGAEPFIVPAMGSHGGATPEGQTEILAEYGISEAALKVPVKAAIDVERVGVTEDGVDVYCGVEAIWADSVVVVNRVKPHTDFSGAIGSGILKMMVIGLGKRVGAATFHAAATRLGYEHTIRTMARVTLRAAPILCGVAIVEDQFHRTARITVLKRHAIEHGEEELFADAKRLMPRLPFDEIDLLIVDRLGKNISGAGMDPNIIGRGMQWQPSSSSDQKQPWPVIRRILVRDLTPESHGNAIGIGFADFTTKRLLQAMDKKATYINALTSLTPNSAKIPISFDTDREAIAQSLATLALRDPTKAKVVRIADTLSLENLEVSEAYAELAKTRDDLAVAGNPAPMEFDADGNLMALKPSK